MALKATEQPVDTGTAAGNAFLDMVGVLTEFETNLRRERQLDGISAAKARGVYKGRQPMIDAAEVLRLRREEKLGPAAIARRLGIGRASVYRLLGKQRPAVALNGGGDADQTCDAGVLSRGLAADQPSRAVRARRRHMPGMRQATWRDSPLLPDGRWFDVGCRTLAQRPRPPGALAGSRGNSPDPENTCDSGCGAPRS